jgi:hypothetical protein
MPAAGSSQTRLTMRGQKTSRNLLTARRMNLDGRIAERVSAQALNFR